MKRKNILIALALLAMPVALPLAARADENVASHKASDALANSLLNFSADAPAKEDFTQVGGDSIDSVLHGTPRAKPAPSRPKTASQGIAEGKAPLGKAANREMADDQSYE